MVEFILLFVAFVLFEQGICNSFVLSDGQLRIISRSDTCNIGTIEMNDNLLGWTPLTISDCDTSIQSFDSNIADLICKQLGFNKLNSYQGHDTMNIGMLYFIYLFLRFCEYKCCSFCLFVVVQDENGYNVIDCDDDAINICKQCKFEKKQNIISFDDCDYKSIEIECDQAGTDLRCIPMDEYIENDDDDNMEYKCNVNDIENENIISFNLASKPFYEDDTFILVMACIGFVVFSCLTICLCNYCQVQYEVCMKYRKCILCLTCKCMSYEGGDLEPVPFDVSDKKKADLRRAQKDFDNQTAYW